MLIGKKTRIWDNNLNIYINNVQVNETKCTKYLGLFIDNNLSWDMQCDKLCRHISGKIAVLRRIRSFIKPSIMKSIYDRTVQPVIDYGCSVWYNTTCKNLEKLQNYAARIISGNFDYINVRSIPLIRSLKWMTISERCEYFTAMLMFKAINGLVPNYLSDSIAMASEAHDWDTRLSESLDAHIPSHNSSALKRSFIYNGSVLWNALPEEIKASDSLFTFFGRLPLKMDFMYFVYFMCVEIICVHRATWENSQWLNVLPCINILEIKKKKNIIHAWVKDNSR